MTGATGVTGASKEGEEGGGGGGGGGGLLSHYAYAETLGANPFKCNTFLSPQG